MIEPAIIIFVVVVLTIIIQWAWIRRLKRQRDDMESRLEDEKAAAIKRSKAVSLGKAVEHLVPFMPDFPYDPSDSRFLGSPIDFVVFDGLRDSDKVREVVFVEVKTGSSSLSRRELSLKDAITSGRVSWREERV